MKKQKSITYSDAGVNYESLDPIKKMAQNAALNTAKNLKIAGFEEISDTRGESAYVWKQGDVLMASVIEGLGTKNLVADEMRKIADLYEPEPQSRRPERNQRTYYDIIGHDTVATIINDLITVGAKPLVLHAYWATGNDAFLVDKKRMQDFIKGWKNACNLSGVTWGGGETPTLKGIINPDTIDLGGSATGIIQSQKKLITDKKLKAEDRILLLKSNGVNANGISLARAIAKKLKKGYAELLSDGQLYGEALLTKTNIYAKLIQDLLNSEIDIHYISNITGHGFRKIMRARPDFTYSIEKIFDPQEVFLFIQKHANLSDKEMYGTYNMGMDYAIFLPEKDIKAAQKIVKQNGFESLDAGVVQKGDKQVIIKPKNITFKAETLDLR